MAPYRSLFDREPAGDAVSLRPNYAYEEFDRTRWQEQRRKRKSAMRAAAAEKRK